MTHRAVLRSAFAFVVMLLLSATAHAQLFRAYLASDGLDSNPCTLPAPCRLLPKALTAVASGGEIWMLDSANYNIAQVDVTKSVTILAIPGALGSVVAAGGNAINIATAGVKVALRNLVIVPFPGGGGTNGINMTNGAGLTVENCLIANLPQKGILVNTNASVRVTDTTIRDNGVAGLWLQDGARATVTRATISGNGTYGVLVYGALASTTTTADIADSTMDGNSNGVYAWSQNASAVVKVSVRDSRAVRNGLGVAAESDAGAAVTLSVSDNMISNNSTDGIGSYLAGSKVWASGNTVSDNGVGLHNESGLFESAGNNAVRNNGTDTFGTITVIATTTLLVTITPTGSGTVTSTPAGINCGADCTENYNYGTVVTLTATASTGSTFSGWGGACSGTGSCMLTMDAAKSVSATFSLLATATLTAVADNTMFEENGDLSNGAGIYFFVGRTAGMGGALSRRGLVRFNLAGAVPAGSQVTSATLQLRESRVPGGPIIQTPVALHRVTASWGEGTSDAVCLGGNEGCGAPATTNDATWSHSVYPNTTWSTSGGDFAGGASATTTVGGLGSYQWTSPQLAADVQAWVNAPTSNFGWVIKEVDESVLRSAKRFDSRQNAAAANRPQLVIEYNAPPVPGRG